MGRPGGRRPRLSRPSGERAAPGTATSSNGGALAPSRSFPPTSPRTDPSPSLRSSLSEAGSKEPSE